MNSRQKLKFAKAEILLITHSYQVHPCNFEEIISEIRENLSQLPTSLQDFYRTEDSKKLKTMIREKITRMIKSRQDEKDLEIKKELDAIFETESTLNEASQPSTSSNQDAVSDVKKEKPQAKEKKKRAHSSNSESDNNEEDIRTKWARKQASEDSGEEKEKKSKQIKEKKKKSTRDTMKENIKMQNAFLKYLMKNKKKILNLSSESETDSD